MSQTTDDDTHEHWPASGEHMTEQPVAAPGYNANNGLHYHSYIPANASSPAPQVYHPIVQRVHYGHGPPQAPRYHAYPAGIHYQAEAQVSQPIHYGYAVPTVVYTREPPAPMPQQAADFHTYHPRYSTPEPAAEPAAPEGNPWMGRTKKEVAEDRRRIGKREGANNKRQMMPTDVDDAQLLWVVELDKTQCLRYFRDIKEMAGEWRRDPRHDGAPYFVREQEDKD